LSKPSSTGNALDSRKTARTGTLEPNRENPRARRNGELCRSRGHRVSKTGSKRPRNLGPPGLSTSGKSDDSFHRRIGIARKGILTLPPHRHCRTRILHATAASAVVFEFFGAVQNKLDC